MNSQDDPNPPNPDDRTPDDLAPDDPAPPGQARDRLQGDPPRTAPPPAGVPNRDLPNLGKIVSRLGRLRGRIRAIFATIGASRWIVAVIALLGAYFLADWLLELPLAVRRFVRLGLLDRPAGLSLALLLPLLLICTFLAVALSRRRHRAAPVLAFATAGLVGLLVWLAARLLLPLRVPLRDSDLALSVESRIKSMKDRLAAALDFERELRNPTRGESDAMMRVVVNEAAEAARGLSFSGAVSARHALQWAGFALLAVGLAATISLAFPDTVGLWARRSLLLRDEAWPNATDMVAVDLMADGRFREHDAAQPFEVPIGRALTVFARAQKKVPGSAQVLDLVAGQNPLARQMFRIPGHEDLFAYEFLDVRRPFEFIVRGGDDDDDFPRYRVEITIPPRVIAIHSSITFPDYLQRAVEQVPDGAVTIPEGSRVRVTFTTDVEIAEAQAVLGDQTMPATAAPGSAGRAFSFEYDAVKSGHCRLMLRTPAGKANDPASDSFEVRVKRDRAPRVDWIHPRISLDVTPNGRLALLAQATDDHGVSELALEVAVGSFDAKQTRKYALTLYGDANEDAEGSQIPLAVLDGPYGRRRILAYLPVEIAALRTEKGEAVTAPTPLSFRLVARDFRGQIRESEWARVEVRPPPALHRGLAERRGNVRLQLEAVQREQRARRDELAELRKGPLDRAGMDMLKTIRFAQGKIAQDADRTTQELIQIFNGFVFDRLGAENPNAKILAYIHRHHRATYGLESVKGARDASESAGRPGEDWRGSPVFPYALYDDITAAWRAKEIYDRGLLDKMCAALADAVEVAARLSPRAAQAAVRATSGESADLQALLTAQDDNLAALDRLLESMIGWQGLSDITLRLRGIIDDQTRILKQMEKPKDGARPAENENR